MVHTQGRVYKPLNVFVATAYGGSSVSDPNVMYRYRVVETWGTMAGRFAPGQNLLEPEDRGPDTHWSVWSYDLGQIVGGVVGEFVDTVAVCACGKSLVSRDHDCSYRPAISALDDTNQGQVH